MLLRVETVKRYASDKPAVIREEYVDPSTIQRVRDSGENNGEPCVEILTCGEWLRCLGTVQQVGHAINELCLALEVPPSG